MRQFFKSRLNRDLVGAALIGVVIWYWAAQMDLWDVLHEWTRDHEEWELDEVLVAFISLGIAGFIFAFRRLADLRAEVRRRESAEADTNWMSEHDLLTQLPNRTFLEKFANKQGNSSKVNKAGDSHSVFLVELSEFKKFNDLNGPANGNAVLIEMAKRIKSRFREDLVVRYSGDEFAIVVKNPERPPEWSANQLLDLIRRPVRAGGQQFQVAASVGVACTPSPVSNLADAIRAASLALEEGRKNSRRPVNVFDQGMDKAIADRAELERDLRAAVANGDIKAHYQPLMDLSGGRVRGFEALARWQRADGTHVPPSTFIQLAENTKLIGALTDQLLRQACADAQSWPSDTILAFNISPCQLGDELLGGRITKILSDTGLAPERLEIEVTESALVGDMQTAATIIDTLHSAGVKVALDDFGTGYSSLSQLSKLNFDKIKIDRSFINDCTTDNKQEKIVKSIVGLGHGLGLMITAEGIEENCQKRRLEEMGCDIGQGYLFGKAMPAESVAAFLETTDGPDAPPHFARVAVN